MSEELLIQTFVEEAREYLDEVEPALIELKEASEATGEADAEILDSVFRLFHSIKGSASFLNFDTVSGLTHDAETLLDLFRKKTLKINIHHVSLLCRAIDLLQVILDSVTENLSDKGFEEQAGLISQELVVAVADVDAFDAAAAPTADSGDAPYEPDEDGGFLGPAEETVSPEKDPFELIITSEMRQRFVQEAEELLDVSEQSLLALEGGDDSPAERISEVLRATHSLKGNCGFMGLADLGRLSHRTEEMLIAIKDDDLACSGEAANLLLRCVDLMRDGVVDLANGGTGEVNYCDEMIAEVDSFCRPADVAPEPQVTTDDEDVGSDATPKAETGRTPKRRRRKDIRVDLEKLDNLINLVGELVIAETMVTRNPDVVELESESFDRATHQLHRITTELQDVAMAVRMIPLAPTFRKMIRLVHDLSIRANKQVHLQLVGEETEVDKTLIEQINDPLVHIIRNAVDHGIESAQERIAAGKPDTGTITIEGRHEAGEVWIRISDDGRGLDRERILAKAVQNGLIQGDASDWRDGKVFDLIFEPGFSTAETVTDISGRGVGMDVVRRNIEQLNGRIRVRSKVGEGTTVVLRIPLTLAIIEGMLVRVGKSRYTVPTLTIRESFRPQLDWITLTPDGQETVRLREQLLPIIRLHEVFDVTPRSTNLDEGILLVVEDGDDAVCVFVDEILGQQQAVIKGMTRHFGEARGVSGCTILGDGEVSLILDIGTLLGMVGGRLSYAASQAE